MSRTIGWFSCGAASAVGRFYDCGYVGLFVDGCF